MALRGEAKKMYNKLYYQKNKEARKSQERRKYDCERFWKKLLAIKI